MTLDLFLNVPELDALRPRAEFYRTLRVAGHRMVGERYLEDDEFGAADRERRHVRRAGNDAPGQGGGARAFLRSIGSHRAQEIEAFLLQLQDRPDAKDVAQVPRVDGLALAVSCVG